MTVGLQKVPPDNIVQLMLRFFGVFLHFPVDFDTPIVNAFDFHYSALYTDLSATSARVFRGDIVERKSL